MYIGYQYKTTNNTKYQILNTDTIKLHSLKTTRGTMLIKYYYILPPLISKVPKVNIFYIKLTCLEN